MPIRVILYVIVMVIIAIFLGINGSNSCDINLLFKKFTDIPVITTILISFAAGILVMLPFTIGRRKKHVSKLPTEKKIPVKKSKVKFSKNKKDDTLQSDASKIYTGENYTDSKATNKDNGSKK